MTHSDDKGLVLPPKLAPFQVVIIPIYKSDDQLEEISEKVKIIQGKLEKRGITVKYDDRQTHKPGWKFAEYELKGVPVRLALGMRDIGNDTIEIARRDTLEKVTLSVENIEDKVESLLSEIQDNLFNKANQFREEVGDFGTLLYAGHDWADVDLAKNSMKLMAEKVMPKINKHSKIAAE